MLKHKCAIVYILVDWSGPERRSRYNVFTALSTLDKSGTPVFKIDCSEQTNKYVEQWLIKQMDNKRLFYSGGWGEHYYWTMVI